MSLIEKIHLMEGHGGKYSFAQDEGTMNNEILNGQKEMNGLIDGIYKDMEEAGVEDHIRVKTKIGWLLFWSDGFLHYFIKKKITVFGFSQSLFACLEE